VFDSLKKSVYIGHENSTTSRTSVQHYVIIFMLRIIYIRGMTFAIINRFPASEDLVDSYPQVHIFRAAQTCGK